MTRYKTLNVILSSSQLNKLKSEIRNGTKLNLKISSNVVGDSTDGNNTSYRLTVVASATDAAIHEKKFGSGMTTLIVSYSKRNKKIYRKQKYNNKYS